MSSSVSLIIQLTLVTGREVEIFTVEDLIVHDYTSTTLTQQRFSSQISSIIIPSGLLQNNRSFNILKNMFRSYFKKSGQFIFREILTIAKWLCCLTSKSVLFVCVGVSSACTPCYLLGGSGGRGLSWSEERWGECRGEGWWWGAIPLGDRERVPRGLGGWPNCWRRSEPDLTCAECEERGTCSTQTHIELTARLFSHAH